MHHDTYATTLCEKSIHGGQIVDRGGQPLCYEGVCKCGFKTGRKRYYSIAKDTLLDHYESVGSLRNLKFEKE